MKPLFALAILGLLFNACSDATLRIDNHAVGPISSATSLAEVAALFPNDSLAGRRNTQDSLVGEVELYDAQGTLRMIIFPKDENDPKSTISFLRIVDPQFTTKEGLGVASSFGDLKKVLEITGVDNAINAVVVYFKDTPWYVSIDKKELPENIRYDYERNIEQAQIPEDAKIKYFFYAW